MSERALPQEIARRTLFWVVIAPAWGVIALVGLLCAAGLRLPPPLEYVPFALSFVLFGLPHGAVDHLVPDWLSGRGPSARSVAKIALLYLVLGSLYLLLWFAAPGAGFALFITLTWLHWGAGDLYSLKALLGGVYPAGPASSVLTVLVRGSLPMLVPLLAFPEVYREVVQSVTGLFAADSAGMARMSWAFDPQFRLLAGLVIAVFAVAAVVLHRRGSAEQSGVLFWADAAETAMLAAYFSFVPPVFAIGLYFCLWHALRHVARLMLLDKHSAAALARGRTIPAFVAFFSAAAPLTLAALVMLGVLYSVIPGRVSGTGTLLALYLVLISILTLPHVVVVGIMDYRQRTWR